MQSPFPGAVPAHLDLDAEDGPVLGEAEGLQPRQVGKAHGVTAQRVHVLVTATLCGGRGQTHRQGIGSGLFVRSGAASLTRRGVGTPHTV